MVSLLRLPCEGLVDWVLDAMPTRCKAFGRTRLLSLGGFWAHETAEPGGFWARETAEPGGFWARETAEPGWLPRPHSGGHGMVGQWFWICCAGEMRQEVVLC